MSGETFEFQPLPPARLRLGLDARALFNPAFAAALIARAADGHRQDHSAALPLPYAYLVTLMVLHEPTRAALPRVNARLSIWADGHPLLRAEWRRRASKLTETTRAALRFGLRHDLLELTNEGVEHTSVFQHLPVPTGGDAADCWAAAHLLGRWLGRAGPPSTVLVLLGVRP